jgi:hypothetical protein
VHIFLHTGSVGCLDSGDLGSPGGVCVEDPTLRPDGGHDHGVAEGDDAGRDDKQGHRHRRDIQLPVPRLGQLDPALRLPCYQNRQKQQIIEQDINPLSNGSVVENLTTL